MAHRVSPQTTRWELEHKPWDTNLSNNEILPLPHILIGFSKVLNSRALWFVLEKTHTNRQYFKSRADVPLSWHETPQFPKGIGTYFSSYNTHIRSFFSFIKLLLWSIWPLLKRSQRAHTELSKAGRFKQEVCFIRKKMQYVDGYSRISSFKLLRLRSIMFPRFLLNIASIKIFFFFFQKSSIQHKTL